MIRNLATKPKTEIIKFFQENGALSQMVLYLKKILLLSRFFFSIAVTQQFF
jgi:hypothetical protein